MGLPCCAFFRLAKLFLIILLTLNKKSLAKTMKFVFASDFCYSRFFYFLSVKNAFASLEAVTVFCIRVAIVIGPTPPGTGVM